MDARTREGLGTGFGAVAVLSGFASDNARHSSVRLRHMLSALRRTCRSETVGPPIIDCELEIGPGWPELPIIEAMASASEAAASNALYISELRTGLVFANAALRRGCASAGGGSVETRSSCDILLPRPLLGEEDKVVTVVVAVGGRSFEARDMAAPAVGGILPVNSSLCILDFKSSNSSHTVDGAVVETDDSVPSAARGVSGASCISVERETSGEELYVRGVVYDRLDCRYDVRGGRVASGAEGLRGPYDACDSGEISLLLKVRGVVGLDRELLEYRVLLLSPGAVERSLAVGR